jgi:hypothetical protein
MEKICEHTEKSLNEARNITREATESATPYRDALVNGCNNPTLQTTTHQRILNRINIKSHQILIKFEAGAHDRFTKADQPNARPTNHIIKEAINTWLNTPEDGKGPLPRNAITKAVTIYGNTHMMLEMNSSETTIWMHTHLDCILGKLLKCPIKALMRTYVVIARFVPITFDNAPASLRSLEEEMELPTGSIQEAGWIKHPSRRSAHQKVANLKIFCTNPEAANTLIKGLTYILGSRLSIQKDIRAPGVCNKCQMYGHIHRDCKATTETCGLCRKNHQTSTCREEEGTQMHPMWLLRPPHEPHELPVYRQHERLIIDRNPEAVSPYYLTNEEWTWGLKMNTADTLPPPPQTHSPPGGTQTWEQNNDYGYHFRYCLHQPTTSCSTITTMPANSTLPTHSYCHCSPEESNHD